MGEPGEPHGTDGPHTPHMGTAWEPCGTHTLTWSDGTHQGPMGEPGEPHGTDGTSQNQRNGVLGRVKRSPDYSYGRLKSKNPGPGR